MPIVRRLPGLDLCHFLTVRMPIAPAWLLLVILSLLVPEARAQVGDGAIRAVPARTVVFVVDTIRDWRTLVHDAPADADVVVLDGQRDGLDQMVDHLRGRAALDAIHVLSHGEVGRVQLGATWLDEATALVRRDALASIGQALRPGGDLLLYGCAVASDGSGIGLLDALRAATGADVAASRDATGAAHKGGNWVLEIARGHVESLALSPAQYDGLLVAFGDSFDANTGVTASFSRTLGGVGFTYTFTALGDGGDTAWEPTYGAANSASINLASQSFNVATTERFTIQRTDAADFAFSGLYVNNTAGATVTVAGYLDGVLVGSAQTVSGGAAAALAFGGIRVDEVRVTSTDFFNTNLDDFSGNTDPPLLPPAVSATAANSTFTEGGSAVDLFTGVTAVTGDPGQTFSAVTMTVASVSAGSNEILTIGGTDIGLTNGNSGTVTGIGTYSVSVVAGTATVAVTGMTRSDAQMAALVDGAAYRNLSQDPGGASRVVTLTQVIDSGASNNVATPNIASTVTVVAVNDAPTLTATGATPTYVEGGSAVDLFSGVNVSTVEPGQTILALTFTVSQLADGASEILRVDGLDLALTHGSSGTTPGNLATATVSVAGNVATVGLSKVGGISTAAAQAVVDGLAYRNSSDVPTPTTRVVTITGLTDSGGTANGGVDTTTTAIAATVSVTEVNDAPAITAPSSIAVSEDVTTALTGISFSDVDAGSSSVTVSLAVPSGTLSATSGSGVTALGSGTGSLTLTGAIAALNSFLASSSATFTTAVNAVSNVTLTVVIDDGGHTGTGGSQTATTTITLSVSAVNDAPVHTVPGPQTVSADIALVFALGNGNAIGVADVDAGPNTIEVTLTATHGLLTLSGITGLSFTAGSGVSNATMTFSGTLANINSALSGLSFMPTGGYTGAATLQIATDDLGATGSGGAKTDADIVAITVTPGVPVVTSVQATTVNGSYKPGDVITVTVSFDQTVQVDTAGGTPTLLLETGATDRLATYVGGAGTTTLAFTYTVQVDDISSDLDYQSTTALALNGATIQNAGSLDAVTTLPVVGSAQSIAGQHAIVIDGVRPTVTSTTVPAIGTYVAAQALDFTVQWTEAVVLNTLGGVPRVPIDVGGTVRYAHYVSGSGSQASTFRYTVVADDHDPDGITLGSIESNGATLRDAAGNDAALALQGVPSTAGIRVDARAPTVTTVTVPAAGTYGAGHVLTFGVAWSEAVTVTGTPSLLIELDAGGPLVATYVTGSGTSTLQFAAIVQSGQADDDGIAIAALTLGGGTIVDAPGNAATLALHGVGATTGVLVDTQSPSGAIGAPSVTATVSGPVTFEVTYAGTSTITLATSDVVLITTGTATGTVSVGGSGGRRTVTVSDISGVGTLAIDIASGTAADAAGNLAPAIGPSASVDVVARALTSVYPSSGLATGGVEITIRGVGFATVAMPQVRFGTTPATAVHVVDDTTMRVVSPALPAGSASRGSTQITATGRVAVVLIDGQTQVSMLADAYLPLPRPADETVDTDQDSLPDAWELRHGLDAIDIADAAQDADGDGRVNRVEFTEGTHPRGHWRRYFAEGVSSEALATAFTVYNPGDARASIVVHYLRDNAPEVTETIELESGGSLRRGAAQVPALASTAFATELESSVPLVATSLTTWDASEYGAGAESAIDARSTWYLAEGATQGPFDLFYLLANPNAAPIEVDVTYLRPAPAAPLVQRVIVPARQRLTLWVDTVASQLAATDVSAVLASVGHEPFVVERAMYAHDGSDRWGVAGHRAAGVVQPATTWHLAEGYVGDPFDTYVLIANPQASAATVSVEAHGEAGVMATQVYTVGARSRLTLFAGDMDLPDGPVAFSVRVTEGAPVVVERAMWWRASGGVGPWVESHASAGATAGAYRWGLTDLQVGGARDEAQYVLVQNVDDTAASVEFVVHLEDGRSEIRTFVVAPHSRLTIDVAAEVPAAAGATAGAVITSTGAAVVVEASRYWDAAGVRWGAGTNVRATELTP